MADNPNAPPFQQGKNPNAIPTNIVLYKGRRMPARIDPDASVARIVEIMASSFGAPEHHITLALRDEADNLVTQKSLPFKVASKEVLKLCPSPVSEALAVVNSLQAASLASGPFAGDSTVAVNESGDMHQGIISPKLALFNLQKFIKEEDFAIEFMLKGGVRMLVNLLERDSLGLSGNSLAYALQGVRGIMDFEHGWGDFSDSFIDRIILVLSSSSSPNILRPATVIVRKLVISSPNSLAQSSVGHGANGDGLGGEGPTPTAALASSTRKGKQRAAPTPEPTPASSGGNGVVDAESVNKYGFDRMYARMKEAGMRITDDLGGNGVERVFRCIVRRLEGTRDLELVAQSLALINTCLRQGQHENSKLYTELVTILEALGTRRYVARLIPTCSNNVVEPRILDYQSRYATILRQRAFRPVRPAHNPHHERLLQDIWVIGRLGVESPVESGAVAPTPGSPIAGRSRLANLNLSQTNEAHLGPRTWEGWNRAGLYVEHGGEMPFLVEAELFRPIGELGLECLHYFASHEENFYTMVLEQQARLPERRCPIGRASNECVKVLYEYYRISQSGHRGSSQFQPFLLNFPRLHYLVLKFWLRMWQESESQLEDFDRVAYLVRSQVRISLADEATRTWLNLERDMLETDYKTIRDRQMELADKEDGMLDRSAVRELREKVNHEAYDVVSEQRIGCMLQGSWFNSASVLAQGINPLIRASTSKPLRFVRLSPNRKVLAWGEFAQREAVNPSFDSLRERIELANVTDVRLQTGCAVNSRSPTTVSRLSFSLMSGEDLSLLDLDAVHAAQLAEWTDGLRVLKGEGGMAHQESANLVHVLTELSLKVRLLDITGDGIDVPPKVLIGSAPRSTDFWFAT